MKYTVKGKAMNPDAIYGKSAYEIAVMHGFEGTEEEWLDSLVQDARLEAEQIHEDIKNEKAEAQLAIRSDCVKAVDSINNHETKSLESLQNKRDELANTFFVSEFPYSKSLNLYDESKQTIDTIRPKYYVNGEAYSETNMYTSPNLLPYPFEIGAMTLEEPVAISTATIVDNGDGSLTASGTPDNAVSYVVYRGLIFDGIIDEFVFSVQGEFENVVGQLDLFADGVSVKTVAVNSSIKIKLSDYPTATHLQLLVKRKNNGVEMAGTIYPMVNIGSTALPYEPYGTKADTRFDNIYNRTALIEIQPSTTYTLALVPVTHVDYPLPWGRAEHGVFFYDENGEWITHSQISKATFTTPSNAKYLAFNYYKDSNDSKNTLDVLNSTCMLVLGDEAPTEYSAYGATITVEERLKNNLDRAIESTMPALYFSYNNVEELYVSAKYNNTHDAVYLLRREGGNKIFDFKKIGTIANADDLVSPNFEKATYFIGSSGDWHAPFQVLAVNNGNGDHPTSVYFTGGNHNYNNASDNNASATGRTAEVRVFANNKEVAIGSAGYANRLEVKWVNYVQGYNTTKQDGTGREILKERHTLSFDGRKWESSVELEALEDIKINLWYGFQCAGLSSVFSKVRYLGAKNRGVYSTDAASDCGDNETYHFEAYGDSHKLIMMVDPLFDLGKRKYCTNNKAVFATTYGKAYFSIINTPLTISGGETYCLKGSYEFCAMTNEFEGSGGSASYDYSVSGTWVFNDTVNVEAEVNQTINFTSYSSAYTRMAAFVATDGKQSVAYYGGSTAYCYNDAWASEIYKTVSFGSAEQEVSQEFYEWLAANATKQ